VNDKFNGAIKMSKRIGSNFDDFLESEGILAEVESVAWKRVISFQIEQLMEEQKLSKTTMAERMHTSRAAIDRLLDSNNGSATLQTLEKAAIVLGKRLRIELI
jgi:antitoxin HicB